MKTILRFMAILGLVTFCSSLSAVAGQRKSEKNKESTVWVDAPTGSLIGGGYADSGETRIRCKTMAREKPEFRQAIETLDAQGEVIVRGVGLVPAAVAWQTKVPVSRLIEQQAETHLSYGELLIANSLAEGSGKSFREILALRAKHSSWGELSLALHINPNSIAARAKAASDSIRYAEARGNRRRAQNLEDSGYDLRRSQNTSAVLHPFNTKPGG